MGWKVMVFSRHSCFPTLRIVRLHLDCHFISSLGSLRSDTDDHFSSHCVSEERSIVTTLPLCKLLGLGVLLGQLARSNMTPRVLTTQVQRHEDAEHKTHRLEANQDGVARREFRCISRAVDVSSNGTSDVSESDVHRHADSTLGGSANVVAVPRDALGYVWVYAACDEEDSDVLDGVVLTADEHDEADEPADLLARA